MLKKTKTKQKNTTQYIRTPPPPPEKMPAPKHLDKKWAPLHIPSLNLVKNKHLNFLVWPKFTNMVN